MCNATFNKSSVSDITDSSIIYSNGIVHILIGIDGIVSQSDSLAASLAAMRPVKFISTVDPCQNVYLERSLPFNVLGNCCVKSGRSCRCQLTYITNKVCDNKYKSILSICQSFQFQLSLLLGLPNLFNRVASEAQTGCWHFVHSPTVISMCSLQYNIAIFCRLNCFLFYVTVQSFLLMYLVVRMRARPNPHRSQSAMYVT